MKTRLRYLAVGFAMLLGISQAVSSHIYGTEMWHEDIGNNQAYLYCRIYQGCTGLGPGPFSNFSLSNIPFVPIINSVNPSGCANPTLGPSVPVSFQEVTPVCPGTISSCLSSSSPITAAVEYTSRWLVTMPSCQSSSPYIFSFSGCCRTFLDSAPTGNYSHQISHEIYPNQNNSSPILQPVPLYFCEGMTAKIPFGSFDPDGDSLAYVLDVVFESGPTTNPSSATSVPYLPGFSASAPLGPGYQVNLNAKTGLLTITPTTGGIVTGVAGIRINEYRNGNIVGTTLRDVNITMVACPGNPQQPSISNPIVNSGGSFDPLTGIVKYCPGSVVELEFTATDPDSTDILSFESNASTALAGAKDSVYGTNPATYRVTWTPAFSDTLPRTFNLRVTDPTCTFVLSDAISIQLEADGVCLLPKITGTNCQDSTGSIAITPTGSLGPFSYLWSTGDTTPVVSGIPVGIYWVDVVDSSNLTTITDTFFLTANDITLSLNTTPSSCDIPTGSISSTVTGGTAPYSFLWNTGDTTSVLSGLNSGGYNLLVTDALGCLQYAVATLYPPDSCFVEISGTLFKDLNWNCIHDPGEPVLPGALIDLTPGGMALTDSAGFYRFLVDTGQYQVSIFSVPYFGSSCLTNGYTLNLQSYDDDTSAIDFGFFLPPYIDLQTFLIATPAAWHTTMKYDVSVINYGGIPAPAVTWTIDYQGSLSYVNANNSPIIVDPVQSYASWQTSSIPAGAKVDSWLLLFVDSTKNDIGDSLIATAFTNNLSMDSIPENNTDHFRQIVLAAYDPNDKLVTPAGEGPEGFIPQATKELEYVIRFQNTGNFPATVVVLRDTLSPLLKLNNYRTLGFSHPFDLAIEEDSIMVFTFDNIMLPDSASDPLGSQGYIAFRLGLEEMLPIGTEITNQAAIYFDFNAPIYTNTTLNTIYIKPEVDLVAIGDYCEGDELYAYLTTSGKSPHTWDWSIGDRGNSQTGIDTVKVQGPGWYSVTVTDQFGFKGTDSVFVNVTELPVAAGGWDITQTFGEAQFLDSSLHATSWFWDFGDGTTSSDSTPIHQYNIPDLYTVILTVYNDCGQDTSHITVDLRESSIDTWGLGAVEIRPNPFSDQTSILLPIPADWELKLHDSAGRIVRKESFRGEKWILEREELPAGIYLLELQTNQHKTFLKVMIE